MVPARAQAGGLGRSGSKDGATVPPVGAVVMVVGRPATAAAIPQVMALPMRIGAAAPAWLGPTTALVPGSGSRGSLGSASALAPASSGLDSGASPLDSRDHRISSPRR